MASYTNDQLTSTVQKLLKTQRQSTFKKSPLLDLLLKSAVKDDGGLKISFGFGVNEHSAVTQYSSGTESGGMSAADISAAAEAPWCLFDGKVHLTERDELINSGSLAVGRILARRVENVLFSLKNETEKQLLAGTSTILTDLQTMQGVTTTTGWFEELAFGSQTNTVCGVAKSSYTGTLQNQFVNVGSTFATTGLPGMRKVRDSADEVSSKGNIDIVIASLLSYGLYGDTLTTQERFTSKEDLDGGNPSLMFGGAKMYMSSRFNAATQVQAAVGLSMYMLNSQNLEAHVHSGANLKQGPFISYANGQNGRFCSIKHMMQVVPLALNCHGIICNADA
jgi:hypothetical protein